MIDLVVYAIPVLGLCLALPAALFLHELGHAIPIVATDGRAHIVIGSSDGWTRVIGPIRVTVGTEGIWSPLYYGYCSWEGVRSRPVRAIGLLAGPGMTLLVVAATGVATSVVERESLRFAVVGLFYNQAFLAIITLFPMKYPSWWGLYAGRSSDGHKLLSLLRG